MYGQGMYQPNVPVMYNAYGQPVPVQPVGYNNFGQPIYPNIPNMTVPVQPVIQQSAAMNAALNQMSQQPVSVPPKAPKSRKKTPQPSASPLLGNGTPVVDSIEAALNQMGIGDGEKDKDKEKEKIPVFEEYVPQSKRATKVLVQEPEEEEENKEENLSPEEKKQKLKREKEAARYEALARKKLQKKGKL